MIRTIASVIFLLVTATLLTGGCGKSEESRTKSESSLPGQFFSQQAVPVPETVQVAEADDQTLVDATAAQPSASRAISGGEGKLARDLTGTADERGGNQDGSPGPATFPGKPELPKLDIARERLLEYSVALSYKSEDVLESRRQLYAIVSRYGYLTGSQTQGEERLAVAASFRVKVQHLHEVIEQLKAVGELRSESITVADHTETMAWQERLAHREFVRSRRRQNAPADVKTWAEKERLISASEDSEDQAEHEKYKIRDRVAWANFSVEIQGPEASAKIEVPAYRNALVGAANLLLDLAYVLLYLSPFLAIAAGGLFLIRRWRRLRAAKKAAQASP